MSIYAVKPDTHATVRAGPARRYASVRVLTPGELWVGEEIAGEPLQLDPYGTSMIWVQDESGACVWRGLLDEVAP